MADDTDSEINFVQINYEHNLKTAGYLIGGHSACLLLVFAALKDYKSDGPLSGVGIFVIIFGVGLLAAIVNYAVMSLSRSVAINAARDDTEADEGTVKLLGRVHFWALAISLSGASSFALPPMKAYCDRFQIGAPLSFLIMTGSGSDAIRPRRASSKSAVLSNGSPCR
jgi:hypothetical protein